MAYFIMPKALEFTIHPWGKGTPTNTGAQYSVIVNASTTNTEVTVNGGAFNVIDKDYPGGRGVFRELEVGLTAEWQGNATTLCTTQWRGRNLSGSDPTNNSWIVFRPDENQVVTAAWAANTYSGYLASEAGFNSVPFEIQMQFRTNHANVGIGRIKNSSYIRCLYQAN